MWHTHITIKSKHPLQKKNNLKGIENQLRIQDNVKNNMSKSYKKRTNKI